MIFRDIEGYDVLVAMPPHYGTSLEDVYLRNHTDTGLLLEIVEEEASIQVNIIGRDTCSS